MNLELARRNEGTKPGVSLAATDGASGIFGGAEAFFSGMQLQKERVREARFPTACGVYLVFDSVSSEPPLYVGVAATQTIEERWRRQHLRSRAGGSALRRTLGVHLGLVERKLNIRTDGRFYPPAVESAITAFLLDCHVAFVVADSPEDARAIEKELIETRRPHLNIKRS